jgi:hypothetical protein
VIGCGNDTPLAGATNVGAGGGVGAAKEQTTLANRKVAAAARK